MKAIRSAHVIVFKDDSFLLVRHGESAGHITGMYGIPGGRMEAGEEFEDTAIRELLEETGIIVEKKDLHDFPLNQFTADIKRKDGTTNTYTMTVYFTKKYSGRLKKSSETSPVWNKMSDLPKLNLLPNVEKAIIAAKNYHTGIQKTLKVNPYLA